MKYFYKSIKFIPEDHKIISNLARELKKERGGKVYLPGTVLEAVKFYREHRHNPTLLSASTPLEKAHEKGVITE